MGSLRIKLECFESIDSTNSYLKEKARHGAEEGTLVIANTQTDGRGRMGRSFYSPQGLGIYMSLLLRPACPADSLQSLTAFTSVAVCRAIEKVSGLSPEVKWINDIMLGGKKICGILCEGAVNENGTAFVIIGIGLNVITREEDFIPPLRDIAGSLYSQSGKAVERGKLISAIIAELDAMYSAWCEDKAAYLPEYKRRCKMLGSYISVGNRDAIAEEICSDFGLKVKYLGGGEDILHSGEVSIRY